MSEYRSEARVARSDLIGVFRPVHPTRLRG
jgi:hypothetical protein